MQDPVEPFYAQQKEQSADIARLSEDPDLAHNILDPDVAVEGFEIYLEDALVSQALPNLPICHVKLQHVLITLDRSIPWLSNILGSFKVC